MNYQESELMAEARKPFMDLASFLDSELKKLYEAGVLNRADWIKLVEESKLSGQAVINAINRTDYPVDMQKELVKNLLSQYEASVQQTLGSINQRRYSPERIDERLKQFEQDVVTNWGNAYKAKMVSQRQFQNVLNRVKNEHKNAINGIRSIPSKHPKKAEMIDSWLEEYQKRMEEMSKIPMPRLDYGPSKKLSEDSLKMANQPESSKQQNGTQNRSTEKQKKTLFQRLFSGKG